jgi:hypothetical protein
VRYREDTPAVRSRARAEVAAWRKENPGGTVEEMLAALGPGFHKDCGPVLRAALFRADQRRDRQGAGTSASTEAGDPVRHARPGNSPLVDAAVGIHGLLSGCGRDGGAVPAVPPSRFRERRQS